MTNLLKKYAIILLCYYLPIPAHLYFVIRVSQVKEKTEQSELCSVVVGENGFEPLKSKTTDLQSAPFGRSGTLPYIRDKQNAYPCLWSW